jgi:signal transduction histidine kinase
MASYFTSKIVYENTIAAEKTKHDKEAIALNARLEREAKEQEHDLLRSLIGNVAHDLKTPLQSMAMGLDALRATVSSLRVAGAAADSFSPAMSASMSPSGGFAAAGATSCSMGEEKQRDQQHGGGKSLSERKLIELRKFAEKNNGVDGFSGIIMRLVHAYIPNAIRVSYIRVWVYVSS